MKRLLPLLLLMAGLLAAQNVDRERVRAEVRRTADLIAQFTPVVNQSGIPEVQQLWRIAQGEQSSAESYLGRERYRLAAKFTLAAREHGRSALQLIRRKANPERISRELDRTDALIERARAPVRQSGSARAIDLLGRADRWQAQARAAFNAKRFAQALKLGLSARDLALRAWESVRGGAAPELLERALAESDALIAEWSAPVRASENESAKSLLAQAESHQAAARANQSGGRPRAALAEAALARRLIGRAVELVQGQESR
jgi:hypothetical protein